MAKTKTELAEIKTRVEELSTVLQELTEEELNVVLGGVGTLDRMEAALLGSHEESCAPNGKEEDFQMLNLNEESCALIDGARPGGVIMV